MNRFLRRDTAPTRSHYAEFQAAQRARALKIRRMKVCFVALLIVLAVVVWTGVSFFKQEAKAMHRAGESPAHITNGLAARP
jgi:type VI protein secretion system component VasF